MKGLSKREKSLLIILGFAILFYLYYSFFLKPIIGKASMAKENVNKYQIQVNRIRNAKTLIEKQKAELESIKVEVLETLNIMPDRERNPEISLNIKNLAIANKASVNSINFGQAVEFKPQTQNPQDNQKKDEINTQNSYKNNGQDKGQNNDVQNQIKREKIYLVPVTVGLSGDYNQIMNFISAIEKDKRIAQIGTAALSKGQDGRLTGNLSIIFYYSGKLNEDLSSYNFNEGRTEGKADLFK